MGEPIEIFCWAAAADWSFLQKLKNRLLPQEKQGVIKLWDRSRILVGDNTDREIQQHLVSARIFLLLISPDFLADDYCYHTVMEPALKRHKSGEAITIIPVIVRSADWQKVPVLKDIQVVPRDDKPIKDQPNQDTAFANVVKEIEAVIQGLRGPSDPRFEDRPMPSPTEASGEARYEGMSSSTRDSAQVPHGEMPPSTKNPVQVLHGGMSPSTKNPVQVLQGEMSSSTKDPAQAPHGGMSSPTGDFKQPLASLVTNLMHLLKLMVTRRLGWAFIGLLILLSGVLWGVSSPTVPYIGPPGGQNTRLTISPAHNGDIYISSMDKSTFFIARHDDFSPPIDHTKIHLDMKLNFVARPDTISVNDTEENLHDTQAHVIEQLIFYEQESSIPAVTYTASDYNPNAPGYYQSRWWPIAIALIAVGLLTDYVALFVGRKRRSSASPAPNAKEPASLA